MQKRFETQKFLYKKKLKTEMKSMIEHSVYTRTFQGPACWLWDYLRRSGQGGFFLPLSGGVDSSSTALIVFSMCRMIVASVQLGDSKVLSDLRRILGDPEYTPNLATELCNRILVTCYMGTENSSKETRQRAAQLAAQIGW